ELTHARSRGARIYAELVGFGAACDPAGIDVTRPNVGSLDRAAKKAIDEAAIQPGDISLVVTHGTGVPGEDLCESRAWADVLAPRERVSGYALTGAIGSLFAGAGGVELAAAVMALHTQTVPPTVNFKTAADAGPLSFCRSPRRSELEYVITGAFSVGGQSAACVLKRYRS
ncbi:MAG: hypothetical protein ISS78_11535, partial [Phycisphaerae bacterium]|nr:hypothetical protein [Phycisphaerae bacterium]